MLPVEVLKFGSSVLGRPEDLPLAVDEVYRRLREGYRVLAVVSAFAGETDRLFSNAAKVLGADAAPGAVAAYVATGELQSAALLTGALIRAGIAARSVDPREIGFRVEGTPLESDPVAVDAGALQLLFDSYTTLVVPGFFGVDVRGQVALLGRGGSDLSAIYLARTLGARCHLVKNVPGVFDRDPATNPNARRYEVLPWHEASAVAGALIQPKALNFARLHATPFLVSRANDALGTQVSDAPVASWTESELPPQRLRIALLGLGTVGRGVYERITAMPDRFDLLAAVASRTERHLDVPISLLSNDAAAALRSDVDLVIECLGGEEPARSVIEGALRAGKRVVTANKALVAACWDDLEPYSREPHRRLWFSATVGGAVPILETLSNLRQPIRELHGVVNGTSNSVLDGVAAGQTLDAAIREAQVAGFAEADPHRDLSGLDAADKLSLIADAAFGVRVRPAEIARRGIMGVLPSCDGLRWRQIARATRANGDLRLSVWPECIPRESFLGATAGAENRLEIVLEGGDTIRLAGQGAGRWPTTTAIMGDVHEIARRRS